MRQLHVRLTENRRPGGRSYGAVCVTCGVPLLEPGRFPGRARRAARRHERDHRHALDSLATRAGGR